MPSAIDPTKPVQGNPTTESVRDNFAAAKSEIEVLQLTAGVGPTGPPGPTGPAGTINVNPTVITSNPGTNASVAVGGTPQAATLQFTIPRGDAGTGGGGITETQAIEAVRQAAPNFAESPQTLATAPAAPQLAGIPEVNPGWTPDPGTSATAAYTHAPGNTGVLAYPISGSMLPGQRIQMIFNGTNSTPLPETSIPPTIFTVFLRSAPTATAGQITVSTISVLAAQTILLEITGTITLTHLVVVPATTFAGTFTLTSVFRQVNLNTPSFWVKGAEAVRRDTLLAIGGGRSATTSTNGCTVFGIDAGNSVSTGQFNVMVGNHAGSRNTTGQNITAVGSRAWEFATTGANDSTAIGSRAMNQHLSGTEHCAVGSFALNQERTGTQNTGIARRALQGLYTGNRNTAVGAWSLSDIVRGDDNSALGRFAGRYIATGTTSNTRADRSIFIGSDSRSLATQQVNEIVIGYAAIGHGSNTITLGNDQITHIHAHVTTISALSDSRIKENIQPANLDQCIAAVKSLPVSHWKWQSIAGPHANQEETGWMAEDVEKVFPYAVTRSDELLTVRDADGNPETTIVPILVPGQDDEPDHVEQLEVPKTQEFKQLQRVAMTEALPTLWGAVQKLIMEIEELKSSNGGNPSGDSPQARTGLFGRKK